MIRGFLPGEPRFLSTDEVLTLHETGIDAYGGSHGIRDAGLLESALAMPRQGFGGEYVHEFPFGMAAAYLFHRCGNHPFVDGNKRLALAATIVFLRMNGWNLAASEEAACDLVLHVAQRLKKKEETADWLLRNARARVSLELAISSAWIIRRSRPYSAKSPRVTLRNESLRSSRRAKPFPPFHRRILEHSRPKKARMIIRRKSFASTQCFSQQFIELRKTWVMSGRK